MEPGHETILVHLCIDYFIADRVDRIAVCRSYEWARNDALARTLNNHKSGIECVTFHTKTAKAARISI